MTGLFITLEGSEGAGKSTNLKYIYDYLVRVGHQVLQTREPGGTPLSESIRELLLSHDYDGMDSDTELLLVFAARAEHLKKVIIPALKAGQTVLCDRFTDATYAYQGAGRGIDEQRIADLETWVQGSLRPDLTVFLDVPVEIGMKRATNRSAPDRFEKEQLSFFDRIRQGYLQQTLKEPDRYRVIDASVDLAAVQVQIKSVLDQLTDNNQH
ncbi:MAG: dTMP kinase [Gammaproteobacteria bacterium]|nr:dTMP kinase [Gammaproteobacteria bacterium]